MNVILLEKVTHLGDLGDRVEVKAGYARNFLIPQGKATEATKANIERFEARRAELERQQAENWQTPSVAPPALAGKVLTILAKAGDEGKLFGSVGTQDIANAAVQQGLQLARSEVMIAARAPSAKSVNTPCRCTSSPVSAPKCWCASSQANKQSFLYQSREVATPSGFFVRAIRRGRAVQPLSYR